MTADGKIQALGVGTATVSANTVNGVGDSVTLEAVAPQPENPEEYDELRQRWKETLIGKDSLDVNDTAVQTIIETNASAAQQYWENMQLSSGVQRSGMTCPLLPVILLLSTTTIPD